MRYANVKWVNERGMELLSENVLCVANEQCPLKSTESLCMTNCVSERFRTYKSRSKKNTSFAWKREGLKNLVYRCRKGQGTGNAGVERVKGRGVYVVVVWTGGWMCGQVGGSVYPVNLLSYTPTPSIPPGTFPDRSVDVCFTSHLSYPPLHVLPNSWSHLGLISDYLVIAGFSVQLQISSPVYTYL